MLVFCFLLCLSGCGFYAVHSERSQASIAVLSTVDIGLIPNRTGQMLRNELLQKMQPRGPARPARFTLLVSLKEVLQELGIQKDAVATRANLILNAEFTVTDRKNGRQVYSGRARSVNSYDILTSDFATLSALGDARRRAVRQLAFDIRERISVWLLQTNDGSVPR